MANTVWIFNAANSRFAGGAFTTRENAESWIAENKLSGVLTEYPLDVGVFDWAVRNGLFTPKPTKEITAEFVGSFTTAAQQHAHYEDGFLA